MCIYGNGWELCEFVGTTFTGLVQVKMDLSGVDSAVM